MKLSEIKYEVPQELIAQYPLEKRDESRLMVLNRKNKPGNIVFLRICLIICRKETLWLLTRLKSFLHV